MNTSKKRYIAPLGEKSLDECFQLGINPNANPVGHLPNVEDKDVKRWVRETFELALSLSNY